MIGQFQKSVNWYGLPFFESEEREYFHVTTESRWEKIKKQGLVPRKEKRGKGFEETRPAIYLFNSEDDAEDGINWLEDVLPEDETWLLLRVRLPSNIVPEEDPELPLSASVVFERIPPQYITLVGEY